MVAITVVYSLTCKRDEVVVPGFVLTLYPHLHALKTKEYLTTGSIVMTQI